MRSINATRKVAVFHMGLEPSRRELPVVVNKGIFVLPRAGEPVWLADEQLPMVVTDTLTGEPGFSAPAQEIDFAPRTSVQRWLNEEFRLMPAGLDRRRCQAAPEDAIPWS